MAAREWRVCDSSTPRARAWVRRCAWNTALPRPLPRSCALFAAQTAGGAGLGRTNGSLRGDPLKKSHKGRQRQGKINLL